MRIKVYYTIGGFTLDDTVLPSGEIRWEAAGGNALYSAVGVKIWGREVGIITPVGIDYPQSHLDTLSSAGFDIRGIRRIDHPSFHVWVLHEGRGRRQIIYRLDSGINKVLDPTPEDLPTGIGEAQGVHICPILGFSQAELMKSLQAAKVPVFLDLIVIPSQIDVTMGHSRELWTGLRAFLPSYEEVRALFGNLPIDDLLQKVREVGPEIFAVKLGSNGSVVYSPRDQEIFHVPAYPADVVDATGAGDSFCGGFMVGLQETDDPVEAALHGTVSSSFLIEGFGALHALDTSLEQAQERLQYLREKVIPLKDAQFVH